MPTAAIPALDDAIANPGNPDHLMVIKDVPRRIRVYSGNTLLADTTSALRVIELGKSVYDPVIYIPEEDLQVLFETVARSSHCPIKGDASYISFAEEEIGWVYREPIDVAKRLGGHYAFWPDKVSVLEGG